MKTITTALVGCVLLGLLPNHLALPEPEVPPGEAGKPRKKWSGRVLDDLRLKDAPLQLGEAGYITDARAWAKMWTSWRPEEAVPVINFMRELVVVVTVGGPNSVGIHFSLEQGNLHVRLGAMTLLFGPGFRYSLFVFPRQGIVTIEGKRLAKK